MGALAFVYLGSVALAAPLHMLEVERTVEPAVATGAATTADAASAAASGWDGAAGEQAHDHGSDHTGELPEAPHEHGADCLTCGLLTLPAADAVSPPPARVPGAADEVFAPRGLALYDRAVVNPRLRGPPVT